jgi:DNA-binding TFAR19-related protein (PDSD5 family)
MAKLTFKARKRLPTSQFAGPDRSYPVEDKGHAVAAKGRATQAVKAGRMSESTASKIKAKANRVLRVRGK